MRRRIRRPPGEILVADDDRGSACFVDGRQVGVMFLELRSGQRGGRTFLRLCRPCLAALFGILVTDAAPELADDAGVNA